MQITHFRDSFVFSPSKKNARASASDNSISAFCVYIFGICAVILRASFSLLRNSGKGSDFTGIRSLLISRDSFLSSYIRRSAAMHNASISAASSGNTATPILAPTFKCVIAHLQRLIEYLH